MRGDLIIYGCSLPYTTVFVWVYILSHATCYVLFVELIEDNNLKYTFINLDQPLHKLSNIQTLLDSTSVSEHRIIV